MPVPHYLIIKPKPIPITKLRKETSCTQSVGGAILLISLDLEREPNLKCRGSSRAYTSQPYGTSGFAATGR